VILTSANRCRFSGELEPRFGRLARGYQRIAFDKEILKTDATCERPRLGIKYICFAIPSPVVREEFKSH
jgi:hypothetical protein